MSDLTDQPTLDAATSDPAAEATVEAKEPRPLPEGWVTIRLVTELGEADIQVPPRNKWGSIARNRLLQGDDLGWAVMTLHRDDYETWIDLDPTSEESETFFTAMSKTEQVNYRSDRRRHLRAAS